MSCVKMKLVAVLCTCLLAIQSAVAIGSRGTYCDAASLYPRPDSGPSEGYAPINSDKHTTWPRRRPHYVIPYCFVNPLARDDLFCAFTKGWQVWFDALRGEAGPETGHGIGIFDVREYCCTRDGYDIRNMRCNVWNPAVPPDTLAIMLSVTPGIRATTGYIPAHIDNRPGRHHIQLHKLAPEGSARGWKDYDVAHEIGHVLGMVHEHQRNDRDNYVEYRPEKTRSYDAAFWKATMEGGIPAGSVQARAANDWEFCKTYGFNTGLVRNAGFSEPVLGSLPFDYESIMIYYSEGAAADVDGCKRDLNLCPLVGFRGEGNQKRYFRITERKVPSRLDLEFIRIYYGWRYGLPPGFPPPPPAPTPVGGGQ